jgi:hypothetical protein
LGKRWEGDERRGGIGSGESVAPYLTSFLGEIGADSWLTEDPTRHLGPKLEEWLAGPGTVLWILESCLDTDDGWLEIRAVWRRAGRARDLRADVAALVGSFAEAQTMLVTVGSGLTATFVVATGQPSDAEFAAHGHLVRVIPQAPPPASG